MTTAGAVWSGLEVDPADPRPADGVPSEALLRAGDPREMPGQWVDAGLTAWFRESNRVAYQHARWVLETSRAQAGTRVRVLDRPRSGKVVAASSGWSEGYADYRIEFARQILERLPALGDAMADGVLEERKALIFTTTLADLDTGQARLVVDRLLGEAPGLAFGRLRTRVEQTAQALDPGWAAARRAAAVARRRVGLRVAPSGAAELCGFDLPEEPAQDAYDRIVALGRAVTQRLRAQGLAAPRGPIESEVMLTVTGPTGAGMWDSDVIDHVYARFTDPDDGTGHDDPGPTDPGPADPGPSDGSPRDGGPDDGRPEDGGPEDGGPDDGRPDDGGPGDGGPGDGGPGDGGPGDGGPGDGGPGDGGPGDGGPSDGGPSDGGPGDGGPDGGCDSDASQRPDLDDLDDLGGAQAAGKPAAVAPTGSPNDPDAPGDDPGDDRGSPNSSGSRPAVPFVARVALRVGLLTVLGLDRRPGKIPGRGVVTSAVARAMAWARTDGAWRLLLYDHDAHLEHVLLVRPPHRGPPAVGGRRRHHLVEVTASTAQLDALLAGFTPALYSGESGSQVSPAPFSPAPPFRAADVAGVAGVVGVVGVDVLGVLERVARALARARARPESEHPACSTADAERRFPGAALRAWVQARDRTCRAPGCDADAVTCDLDHTLDWHHHGPTVAADLGAFCRRDHLFKHDPATGWTVTQPSPGHFVWTAPTGRVHHIVPERHDPLPDPLGPADGSGSSFPTELLDPPPPELPPGLPRRNHHGHLTKAAKATSARLQRRARGEPEPATSTPGPDDEPPF